MEVDPKKFVHDMASDMTCNICPSQGCLKPKALTLVPRELRGVPG